VVAVAEGVVGAADVQQQVPLDGPAGRRPSVLPARRGFAEGAGAQAQAAAGGAPARHEVDGARAAAAAEAGRHVAAVDLGLRVARQRQARQVDAAVLGVGQGQTVDQHLDLRRRRTADRRHGLRAQTPVAPHLETRDADQQVGQVAGRAGAIEVHDGDRGVADGERGCGNGRPEDRDRVGEGQEGGVGEVEVRRREGAVIRSRLRGRGGGEQATQDDNEQGRTGPARHATNSSREGDGRGPGIGLLARGSSYSPCLPGREDQWRRTGFVTAHSGGAAPDSHRLPGDHRRSAMSAAGERPPAQLKRRGGRCQAGAPRSAGGPAPARWPAAVPPGRRPARRRGAGSARSPPPAGPPA